MERIYLFVPPEEYAQVRALGATWDDELKCWYIDADADQAAFRAWLDVEDGDEEWGITSNQAHVASAKIPCPNCRATMAVICLFCEKGFSGGQEVDLFTPSNIWAVDPSLQRQLERWPLFKKGFSPFLQEEVFLNHCPHCDEAVDDVLLHDEPDGVFFSISEEPPVPIQLTPLVGLIRLSGDYHFPA
jgi:hypothetical protein